MTEQDERGRRWGWLLFCVLIGAALMLVGLRLLQEMINEEPAQATPRR